MQDLKEKKVLITGGLGFIGSNLAQTCVSLGADVTIYDCLDPKSGGNMYNIQGIDSSVHITLNDIRNFEGVSAAIMGKDIIFNCAAYTSHPKSMEDPLTDIDVNCKGVINILEAARRFNPKVKVVHVGTSTQIGKMHHKVIDEFHPEFPIDIYSANKSASEKYVLIYGHVYKMNTTVLRLSNVFGPRSNIRSSDFGFINYFIGLALQNKDITIFGQGDQLRSVNYIDDVVDALILASVSPKSNNEVFFVSPDSQHSVAQLANSISHIIGGSIKKVKWPENREAIEIGDAVVSNNKIKNVLQWSPKHTLEEGLEKTRDYFLPLLTHYI